MLKLIMDEHRYIMSHNTPVHFTVPITERGIMRRINLDKILSHFSAAKARKQFISD